MQYFMLKLGGKHWHSVNNSLTFVCFWIIYTIFSYLEKGFTQVYGHTTIGYQGCFRRSWWWNIFIFSINHYFSNQVFGNHLHKGRAASLSMWAVSNFYFIVEKTFPYYRWEEKGKNKKGLEPSPSEARKYVRGTLEVCHLFPCRLLS